MKARKNFIGLEGFVWWVGVVEDRQDPEQLGRVRVRCFGWHTEDKKKIPTNVLPWAHPVVPVNHPAVYTPKEGDMVFGFFMDGNSAQNPVIMGILPGKPQQKPRYEDGFNDPRKSFGDAPKRPDDNAEAYPKSKYLKEATTNRLSRGKADSTIIATRKKNLKKSIKSAGGVTWSEPAPAFAPKYPYNYALETESGHAFELDDTPGKERVHLAHRNGSYFEVDKDGNKVERVQKDNYEVIMGDDFIYVKGKAVITVEGNFNLKTATVNIEAAAINMAADGAIKIKGSSVNIESTGSMDLKAGGAGKFTAGGRLDLKGATAGLGGATVDIPAAKVNLQSGSVGSASGAGITGGGTQAAAGEAAANSAAQSAATQAAATAAGSNAVSTLGSTFTAAANAATGAVSSAVSAVTSAVGAATSGGALGGTLGSALGKTVSGLTSSISGVVGDLKGTLDSTIKDLASPLPIGEIAAKVAGAESSINNSRGDILSLVGASKSEILGKIDTIAQGAFSKNIDFNVDSDIQKEIDKTKNNGLVQIVTVTAKKLYPKTETVNIAVTSANTGG